MPLWFGLHVIALSFFICCYSRLVGGSLLTRVVSSFVGFYLFLFLSFSIPAVFQVLDTYTVLLTGLGLAALMGFAIRSDRRSSERQAGMSTRGATENDGGGLSEVLLAILMAGGWLSVVWSSVAWSLYTGQMDIDVASYHAPAMVEFIMNRGYSGDSPMVDAYFFGYESIVGSLSIFFRTGLFFSLLFVPNLLLLAFADVLLVSRFRHLFRLGRASGLLLLVPLAAFAPMLASYASFLPTLVTKNDLPGVALLAAGVAGLSGTRGRTGDRRGADRETLLLAGPALGLSAAIKPTYAALAFLIVTIHVFWPLRVGDPPRLRLRRRLGRFALLLAPALAAQALWAWRNLLHGSALFDKVVLTEGARYVLLNCYERVFSASMPWHDSFTWHLAGLVAVGIAIASAFLILPVITKRGHRQGALPSSETSREVERIVMMAGAASILSVLTPFNAYDPEPSSPGAMFCKCQIRLIYFHFQLASFALVACAMAAIGFARARNRPAGDHQAESAPTLQEQPVVSGSPSEDARLSKSRTRFGPRDRESVIVCLAMGVATLGAGLWAWHWEQAVRYRKSETVTYELRLRLGSDSPLYRMFMDMEPGQRILLANIPSYPFYGRFWRHRVFHSLWFPIDDFTPNEEPFLNLMRECRPTLVVVGYWEDRGHVVQNPPEKSFVAWALQQGLHPALLTDEVVVFRVPPSWDDGIER